MAISKGVPGFKINLQTNTTSPPQPHNWSSAPTLYLHFFG